jgi:hypothetical protein
MKGLGAFLSGEDDSKTNSDKVFFGEPFSANMKYDKSPFW